MIKKVFSLFFGLALQKASLRTLGDARRTSEASQLIKQFLFVLLWIVIFDLLALGQTVDLEWDPNSEPDLAGYHIYRSVESGTGYSRISAALIPSTSYTDETIQIGQRYYYVATALDTEGLESGYSNEVNVGLCLGDVNQDEIRNILDVLQIANHIVGNLTLEGNGLAVADVNRDDSVNVLDTLMLENYLVGNINLPDCP